MFLLDAQDNNVFNSQLNCIGIWLKFNRITIILYMIPTCLFLYHEVWEIITNSNFDEFNNCIN